MKKFIMKEWDDRGTDKVKISFQEEGHGMKEAILPKSEIAKFLKKRDWL